MEEQESSGTQKVLSLAGPLLTVLKKGWILVVDELDARLHPSLTKTLIHIFSDSKTNPLSAQLIFATHDIGLLDREIFRRDQIWFTEKDKYGATSLYSLAEFKMKDMEPYAEGYVRGRYGAVPFTRALTLLMESPNE